MQNPTSENHSAWIRWESGQLGLHSSVRIRRWQVPFKETVLRAAFIVHLWSDILGRKNWRQHQRHSIWLSQESNQRRRRRWGQRKSPSVRSCQESHQRRSCRWCSVLAWDNQPEARHNHRKPVMCCQTLQNQSERQTIVFTPKESKRSRSHLMRSQSDSNEICCIHLISTWIWLALNSAIDICWTSLDNQTKIISSK